MEGAAAIEDADRKSKLEIEKRATQNCDLLSSPETKDQVGEVNDDLISPHSVEWQSPSPGDTEGEALRK